MATQLQNQHGVAKGFPVQDGEGEIGENDPSTYRMVLPKKAGPRHCPVEGCSGWVETRTAMRLHLWNRHVRYTVVILEEGKPPHPWFCLCGMLVPWRYLNGSHNGTPQCKKGADWKQWQLVEE